MFRRIGEADCESPVQFWGRCKLGGGPEQVCSTLTGAVGCGAKSLVILHSATIASVPAIAQ